MSQLSTVSKVTIAVAAAAASAGIAYYLFRTEEAAEVIEIATESPVHQVVKLDAKRVSAEQLVSIMDTIVDSQNVMKGVMKKITDEIKSSDMTFAATFERVKELQPNDPMEETGLTMSEFDELLDKYQEDPRILDGIAKIMGPSEEDMKSDDGTVLSVKDLIDVHQYMLEELQAIGELVKSKPTQWDARTLTVTAQVLVGAKVEKKFNVGSPAVERSVMTHQAQLSTNHQFATINMMMQQAMTELMGENINSRE